MCDFHSICVRRDGAIAHVPSNSHSGAVEAAGWRENDLGTEFRGVPFFVEAEGIDSKPAIRNADKMNDRQAKTISRHYENLEKLLANPAEHAGRMCFGEGYFAAPEYADVRWQVFVSPGIPARLAEKLADTPLHANGEVLSVLPPCVKGFSGRVDLREGATLTAPVLAQAGDVVLDAGATLTAPVLAQAGHLNIDAGATLTAPVLAQAGRLTLREGATLTAPVLAQAGDVLLYEGVTLTAPVLAQAGDVDLWEGATLTAPVLAQAGHLNIDAGATLTAPVLAQAGRLTLREGATLTAPRLREGGKP